MKTSTKKSGFTLTEVLLSAAILAIGFVLIAGAFPVGVKLTATATERSIAAVTADEAFAKIQLYGLDMSQWDNLYAYTALPSEQGLTYGQHFDYSSIYTLDPADLSLLSNLPPSDPNEYYYPTTKQIPQEEKIYHWSALCKKVDPSNTNDQRVLVTVFVSRLGQLQQEYPANPTPAEPAPGLTYIPEPLLIEGNDYLAAERNRLTVTDITYFSEGSKILDDNDGRIYTVTERQSGNDVVLDRELPYTSDGTLKFWVIPPAVNGGRWPCVGIFQRIIDFK